MYEGRWSCDALRIVALVPIDAALPPGSKPWGAFRNIMNEALYHEAVVVSTKTSVNEAEYRNLERLQNIRWARQMECSMRDRLMMEDGGWTGMLGSKLPS